MRTFSPYLQFFKKRDFLIYCLLLMPIPFLMNVKTNFINILLSSHYIFLIVHLYFLITLYKYIFQINTVANQIITRAGRKVAKQSVFICMCLATGIFMIMLYLYLIIFYGFKGFTPFLFTLLFINSILYFIETAIIFMQFNRLGNLLYIIVPLLVNLGFHYIFFVI